MLGPNINVPIDPEANAPAVAASKRAQALAAGATDKEKALIAAVEKRYSDDPAADRPQLDAAFADAMAALAEKYPEDLLFAVMAAEAAMDQPWDYWQPGARSRKAARPTSRRWPAPSAIFLGNASWRAFSGRSVLRFSDIPRHQLGRVAMI